MSHADRISILAYGDCQEILQAIVEEGDSITRLLEEFGIGYESLSPKCQRLVTRIQSFMKECENVSIRFTQVSKRIKEAEQKPGVREIIRKEQQLEECGRTQEEMRLKREIQHLKSLHASKLSALTQQKQALLRERLELIKLWQNILLLEINVLEESRCLVEKKILDTVNEIGDPDGEMIVREMLKKLSTQRTAFREFSLDVSKVSVHNIHALNQMLKDQLEHIRRIEDAIAEKKEVIQTLQNIMKEVRGELPREKGGKAGIESQGGREPASSEPPPPRTPTGRMVFRGKDRN